MSASATALAWADVDEIAEAWEQSSRGRGEDFLQHFSATMTILESFPRIYGRITRCPRGREVRKARIGNTMYLAVYEVRNDRAEVIAVIHSHRKDSWRSRI